MGQPTRDVERSLCVESSLSIPIFDNYLGAGQVAVFVRPNISKFYIKGESDSVEASLTMSSQ